LSSLSPRSPAPYPLHFSLHDALPILPAPSKDAAWPCPAWRKIPSFSPAPARSRSPRRARSNPVGTRSARSRLPDESTASIACPRSEEHTSELQSLRHLVCRLLLEKKQ